MTSSDHDTNTLAAIGPLVDAGFALHWLKARSKAPAGGDEWQDAPVADAETLRRSHFRGANLGVRLGEPSAVEGGYLYVIDLDIRIPDLADEAWEAFGKLFPGIDPVELPSVISGSGGESRHLYFIADRPFFGKKLAVSEGKHRRFDTQRQKEVWSYDWEIDLFGTSRQVAMPPSIHPDSRMPYRWEREFDLDALAFGCGPTISADVVESLGAAETATYAFEAREPLDFKPGQLEGDLEVLPVSYWDDRDQWIMIGQALHHQFGGSDEGFDLWAKYSGRSLKVDKDFRRANLRRWRGFGRNRRQPVTMGTVRQWAQDARARSLADEFDDLDDDLGADTVAADDGEGFDDLVGTPAPAAANNDDWDGGSLSEEETKLSWTSLFAINEDGKVTANLHNLRLIVENDARTRGVAAFNEFTQEIVQRGKPGSKRSRANAAKPTLQLEGASWVMRDKVNGDWWTEDKDNAIRAVIEAPKTQGGYGIKVPDRDLRAAIDIVGRKNCFHPVREYLSNLKWDRQKRVETLFVDYLGAPDDIYHRTVARIMMVAAVARVFEPGCKFDTAVILEGMQGKRKSTFISVLAKDWFAELDCDVTDTKAVVETLQGAWIVELNELGGFTKADVRHVKAFISRRSDKVRLAYAKRAQEYHRQAILIGSTNDDVYLKDSTGGRRFLPVRCDLEAEIDTERLTDNIDQLWAEALHIYRKMRSEQPKGTLPLYLADAEARETAERLQESRRVESTEDAMAGRIEEWLSKPIVNGNIEDDLDEHGQPVYRNETCLLQIWCECLGREEAQYTGMWPAALGRSMRMVPGWKESTRRPRFGKYGQQRAFEREGGLAKEIGIGAAT
ncbi:VapE domain-containing protein [Novosphingobium resinovorum]|uniref:DNA primase/polymerase bifunctional N-terminal domain-containing protein n=1 Tax=Novosphingobium resinovorum TaxID=158500 RepID=A0A1D8A376_9SPHN|nr:VapE domain-containing protein [Novosphingobium resinovorum]AOR76520.1 hypothetical protein BES08_07015 [Novosphingobium resinovorum]